MNQSMRNELEIRAGHGEKSAEREAETQTEMETSLIRAQIKRQMQSGAMIDIYGCRKANK